MSNLTQQALDLISLALSENMKGGAELRAVHPPELVDALYPDGHITSSLANFGHF